MPGGRTKFCNAWLSTIDANSQRLSTWCRKGADDFRAYCKFCDSEVRCDNAGKSQLLQHAKKAKHVQGVQPFLDSSQGKLLAQRQPQALANDPSPDSLTGPGRQLSIINYRSTTLHSEVIWLAKVSSCNYSFRSVDKSGDTFRAMFPDSKVADGFSMSRTSASYIIGEGLGPHFTQVIFQICYEKY